MASTPKTSEPALAGVLEAIGDAVYAMDRGARILFANRRALELWGKSADAIIGQHLLDAFPGIEHGEPYRAYCAAFETGQPVHIETRAPALADRWIALDVHPGPEDGLVVVFRDIDDRKRAEAALRDSEERFRSMLEALPQLAFVIGPDGNAFYYNRQFRDYAGTPVGPSLADRNALLHPDDISRLMRSRRAAAAGGVEYKVEVRLRRHDGVYRWHRLQNRPMLAADGNVAYWLGTAVDINDIRETNELLEQRVAERTAELEAANRRLAGQIEEREKAEAQLRHTQRIEAIGKLTAGIAHDFNNLMTAIIGNIEMVQGRLGAAQPRTERLLRAALAAAERGASLTAQLLAFSRQQRMRPVPVDLNGIVAGMGALIHSTIGATARIVTRAADDLWPVLADVAQIELVLLNLAINARDAAPDGTITIATGNAVLGAPVRPEEPAAGEYAMVSVADTGPGIPVNILDRVFDPFFTTKAVGKGSGLGLSQVLGVAQQLGGGVRIETDPDSGTVVNVYVPRLRAPGGGAEAERINGVAAKPGAQHRLAVILLVDDDTDVRTAAAGMLHDAGHRVIEAGSAEDALHQLGRNGHAIDMMIADLAMPGTSGVELARRVRCDRPDLPILFVTGFADTAAQLDAIDAHRLLQKPFRAAELTAKVAEALEERHGAAPVPSVGLSSRA